MKRKRLTLDEAVKFLNEHYQMPEGKNAFSKGTLSNYIWKGRLKRFGPKKMVLLDADNLIQVLGEKTSA